MVARHPYPIEDFRRCRVLAAEQRQQAGSERLPRVRSLLEASAERWELLADSHALIESLPHRVAQARPGVSAPLRVGDGKQTITCAGKLRVNCEKRTAQANGSIVRLTTMEQAVLEQLALNRGTVVSKQSLMLQLYPATRRPDTKIIEVLVRTLRKKLARACDGRNPIVTVRKRGYILAKHV